MPVNLEWMDEERTLIFVKVEGRPENEEYFAADARFREMLQSVTHPVDMIQDLSKLIYFSPSYSANMEVLRSFERPNLRSVIFVGGGIGAEIFEAYARQHGGVRYQYGFAETLDDARELVRRARAGTLNRAPRPASPDWN